MQRTMSSSKRNADYWSEGLAGGTAGAVSRITTAPLDVLKIRLQLAGRNSNAQFSTFVGTIKYIYNEEGIKAFWRGNPASMVLWVTYVGTQFCMYNFFKGTVDINHYLKGADKKKAGSHHLLSDKFISGALAASVATILTYPLDILRTTFAGQGIPRKYKNFLSFTRSVYNRGGLSGFYAGLSPALILIAPQMGITFACYETVKDNPPSLLINSSHFASWWPLSAGFISGLISKSVVYPLDTLKKRVQGKVTLELSVSSPLKNTLKQIAAEGIVMSLYRGMVPALWKASVSSAITFGVYEAVKAELQKVK